MKLNGAAEYFKKRQNEVVSWWNPESGLGAETFKRGLDAVVVELRQHNVTDAMDAACGKGRASKELATFSKVTAVDISTAMLGIVADLKIPNVKICEANLEDLPFEAGSFDAIVFLGAAVHLDNPDKVFKEFYRVLRPSGLLILDIDNKFGLIRLLKSCLDPIFSIFDESYKTERSNRMRIFQPLSGNKTTKILIDSGFKINKRFYKGFLMPFRLKNKLIISGKYFDYFKSLSFFFEEVPFLRGFSTYIYFICQK